MRNQEKIKSEFYIGKRPQKDRSRHLHRKVLPSPLESLFWKCKVKDPGSSLFGMQIYFFRRDITPVFPTLQARECLLFPGHNPL